MSTPATTLLQLFCELQGLDAGPRQQRLAEIRERDPDAAEFLARMLRSERGSSRHAWLPADVLLNMCQEALRSLAQPGSVEQNADKVHQLAPTDFRVLDEIGHGGMGVVYKAIDVQCDREVALKTIQPKHLGNATLLDRFLAEAKLTAQLQHPGIAPVYSISRDTSGTPYFAMRLVEGSSLASILAARQSITDRQAECVRIFEQVVSTVAYAHSRGVVHRDLKPQNVMVGAFGEVQVLDWGVAKVLAAEQSTPDSVDLSSGRALARPAIATSVGAMVGTLGYMAPEQANGETGAANPRADVFSLGAILCEILTGEPAFTGAPIVRQRATERGNLTDALARLDRCGEASDLVSLARDCLNPDPTKRFGDANGLVKWLQLRRETLDSRRQRAQAERLANDWIPAIKLGMRIRGAPGPLKVLRGLVVLAILGAGLVLLVRYFEEQERVAAAQRSRDSTERLLRGLQEQDGPGQLRGSSVPHTDLGSSAGDADHFRELDEVLRSSVTPRAGSRAVENGESAIPPGRQVWHPTDADK